MNTRWTNFKELLKLKLDKGDYDEIELHLKTEMKKDTSILKQEMKVIKIIF